MSKRSFLMALAAGLLAWSFGATGATAGTILVNADQGTFNFTLTANGAGNITIVYSNVLLTGVTPVTGPPVTFAPGIESQLHGTGGSESVNVLTTVSAPPLTSYTFMDVTPGIKDFGIGTDAIQTASLQYQVTTGSAVNPGFFNLNANVLSVISPFLETTATSPTIYDFSPFGAGGQMTLTYNKVGANFASVIATGGTITGTGGFTEQASSAPEPASFALLGIGMAGFFAFRRYMKRSVAA